MDTFNKDNQNKASNSVANKVIASGKKFTQSLTWKALIIAFLTLILLIPSFMIMNTINERERLSEAKICEINRSWSAEQTICPPVLVIPYTVAVQEKKTPVLVEHELYIVPESSETVVELMPEVRHISIYKSIVYNSEIHITGEFAAASTFSLENYTMHFDRAFLQLGLSDLRGVTEQITFNAGGKQLTAKADGVYRVNGKGISFDMEDLLSNSGGAPFSFDCNIKLKGSGSINFIPIAKNTKVSVSGKWTSPGFTGNYLPEYTIDSKNENFSAEWNVLSFNRDIPNSWADNIVHPSGSSFGVNLVDAVDHYLLNMRSAKYALMFIALTFVVFFFVEVLTRRRIHPIQYLLVGVALILFYSLLLSLSEQIGFALAYLIASVATIALITTYANSIFRDRKPTVILAVILAGLYGFLYTVLQLEDIALLIGSIAMFLILGIIMFISRKINWYRE